jgi:hypothetical protein
MPKHWEKLHFTTHYEYTTDWNKMLIFYVWYPNSTDFFRIIRLPIREYEETMNCNDETAMCVKNNIIWKNSKYFYIYWWLQDVDERNKELVKILDDIDFLRQNIKVIEF